MAPLVKALQPRLEEVFFRLLRRTYVTARKRAGGEADEVDWIEKFHDLVATDLEDDLRRELRLGGLPLSIAVNSALLHGKPFQAWPRWRHTTARSIEVGDLLLIGEYQEQSGIVSERQALLLQMKVGTPSLPENAPVRGAKAQAELYAAWPPFNWSKKLRGMLPGPFPREPAPGPSAAARFGIIPTRSSSSWSSHNACPVEAGPRLGSAEALQVPMARVVRLDLGIDATPGRGPSGGWSRIVQDMLDVAPLYVFRGQERFASGVKALIDPGSRVRTEAGTCRVPSFASDASPVLDSRSSRSATGRRECWIRAVSSGCAICRASALDRRSSLIPGGRSRSRSRRGVA